MSQHMAAKYLRDSRKRAKVQQVSAVSSKQPRSDAERAWCYRVKLKAAKGNASPTASWDAGEGPSTRVFPPVRLLGNRADNIIGNPGVGEISVNTVDLMVGDVTPARNSFCDRIDQIPCDANIIEHSVRDENVGFSYPGHSGQAFPSVHPFDRQVGITVDNPNVGDTLVNFDDPMVGDVSLTQNLFDDPIDQNSCGSVTLTAVENVPAQRIHGAQVGFSYPEHSGQEPFEPNLEGATNEFKKRFVNNRFGFPCGVCDRLWFSNDLKHLSNAEAVVLAGTNLETTGLSACVTCRTSLKHGKVPLLSVSNGFKFPDYPSDPPLPPLDPISERFISPRLPFMQIRRLRFAAGSYGIIGQVINVPVDVDQMVKELPRQLDDDRAINVCIKKHLVHKTSYLSGWVKKATIRAWLQYLVTTPLYRHNGITFSEDNLHAIDIHPQVDDAIENLESENDIEMLIGQQQTLLWNEDKCLEIAPGQNRVPLSIIYDEHAEELSYPDIYLGQPRRFNPEIKVTPFMMATSELRRRDRRAAKPKHLLYVAMKILRLRVSEGLQNTFRCMGTANITREMLKDRDFLEQCIDRNLSFLKSIPNSVQYWQQRKRDLFAMIRQLGKPTMFLTLSASETKWPLLLETLQRLSGGNINGNVMQTLSALQRATLVNEDPVTCCVYFNKLVDVIMQLLQSSRYSPFGEYRVVEFFKRIEFQHRGSPHAHILLWLNNDPNEAVSENMPATAHLIDSLTSVKAVDLPEGYGNQVHKHTFTCFKRGEKSCRFNIPYWPMDQTRILLPLPVDDGRRTQLKKRSTEIHNLLETKTFETFAEFLHDCKCTIEGYLDIIRASIKRPTVLNKRSMTELWTNPFNPWIANILQSNMDLQFILEEFSCAAYVVEYVNKANRGISSLHRDLVQLSEQFPDYDHLSLLKKVGLKMLNSVEMSAQEAAWYLLRQPMSEASRKVEFIPTMWPHERTKTRKRTQQMNNEGIADDSTDIWTYNVIQKYEAREELDDICLAEFVAYYTKVQNTANSYHRRTTARVLRWRGYPMTDLHNYKREMVLLFLPFRNEMLDLLDCNKFLQLYDEHESGLLQKRKEYDCEFNLEQTVEEYLRMCGANADEEQEAAIDKHNECVRTITMEPNDDDIQNLPTHTLTAVVKQRSNVMSKQAYCEMVRATNPEQRALVLHVIHSIHSFDGARKPLQIFFTGPAGSGKTFTLHVLMETYNRFSQAHNAQNNAYVACASTGKAAVAIGGTTVHSAFRLTMSRRNNAKLSFEILQLYRNAFAHVQAIIVDEVSMIGANILDSIHARLQDIRGEYDDAFGGIDIILVGDFHQLPPVNARFIWKPPANSMHGAVLWQSLEFYPLVRVMRQSDEQFSTVLTKIGNGTRLSDEETQLIESRFRTADWCKQNVPNAIRLFHRNLDVDQYNNDILRETDGLDCLAEDVFSGYRSDEQLASARNKLHKMSVVEAGGLPYLLRLTVGMPYMITTNVEVEDGIVNGAIGELMYVEQSEDDYQQTVRLWFRFENESIGSKLRIKSRPLVYSRPGILQPNWTPITKRSANITLGNMKCKRVQFPVVSACALTVHKSQGGTFPQIVYHYDKGQEQQLVYVGLSRVSSLDGLYLTNAKDEFKFHHAKGSDSPKMKELRTEMERLSNHRLTTLSDELVAFVENRGSGVVLVSANVQSLNAHAQDIATDHVLTTGDLLALSETWQDNEVSTQIEGFTSISQSKRIGTRAAGVAIYQKTGATNVAVPHSIEKACASHDVELGLSDEYGDVCAAEVQIMGTRTLLISLYISPSTTTKQKKFFLARNLFMYMRSSMPIIVTGDFNIDVSKEENIEFVDFMKQYLHLELATDPSQATTLGGSCLDLIFTRKFVLKVGDTVRTSRIIGPF
nr:uncharacterized protein LOC109418586 [Aedes albopictus]